MMSFRSNKKTEKMELSRRNMADDAAVDNFISPEELKKQYHSTSRLTTGTAFGKGNGELDPKVRDEVIRLKAVRTATSEARAKKKVDEEWLVACTGRRIFQEFKKKGFEWTNEKLKAAIKYRRKKGDQRPMPTKNDKLEERWAEVKKNKFGTDKEDESEDESTDESNDDKTGEDVDDGEVAASLGMVFGSADSDDDGEWSDLEDDNNEQIVYGIN